MDRAEAIKWLEGDRDIAKYQEKIFEGSFSEPQKNPYAPIVEIYDMAIAALREQEQREQGCFVCDGWVGKSEDNFCPNCGRKLGGADHA